MHVVDIMDLPASRTMDWPFDNEFWPERELLLAFARAGILTRRLDGRLGTTTVADDRPPAMQGGAPWNGLDPTAGGEERDGA
jgi:hypothetical protein